MAGIGIHVRRNGKGKSYSKDRSSNGPSLFLICREDNENCHRLPGAYSGIRENSCLLLYAEFSEEQKPDSPGSLKL